MQAPTSVPQNAKPMHPRVMVEKGTRNRTASRAVLSSQVNTQGTRGTQVCYQAVHGHSSHVEPQATASLRSSQEASRRPRLRSVACVRLQLRPTAFKRKGGGWGHRGCVWEIWWNRSKRCKGWSYGQQFLPSGYRDLVCHVGGNPKNKQRIWRPGSQSIQMGRGVVLRQTGSQRMRLFTMKKEKRQRRKIQKKYHRRN